MIFFNFFQVALLIILVFIMHLLVILFWHSNDVFIRAHMDLGFRIIISDHEYVVNLDPAVKTQLFRASIDIHDAVRYI